MISQSVNLSNILFKIKFRYQVNVIRNDEEKEKMPSVMNDNVERYLGYGSLDVNSVVVQQPTDLMGEETVQKEDNYFEDPQDPDEEYENFEEINHLMILYRFDQGCGAKIVDLSDHNNHGNIMKNGGIVENENSQEYWAHGELESEKPLAFQDEWGKDSPPNCAVAFDGTDCLRVRGSKNLAKLRGHFTFQIWVKMDEINEFTLFKRQSEDFNVKLKDSKTIEVSRAHSIRNILHFELPEEIPCNEWVSITLVYQQLQQEEKENKNAGLKIYINGEMSYEDNKINFKWPLMETDGLIFLQDFNGIFTELRFWNINLSSNIIIETFKRPLACVNDQRKRLQMDDDQFSFLNQKRKKEKGKRATLVALGGKSLGLGLRSGLRKPPRGSVKVCMEEADKIRKKVTEEIKEEIDEENCEKEQEKSVDKQQDTFEFGFNSQQKSKEKEENFWNDEGFKNKEEKDKNKDNFEDFDWSSKQQNKDNTNDDDFDWDDKQATKKEEKTQIKESDDFWEGEE